MKVDVVALILAALPIIWLVVALGVLRVRAHIAALVGFVIAFTGASVIPFLFSAFGNTEPMRKVVRAAVSGVGFAISPICLIILAALFTYRICKRSGALTVIRSRLVAVSTDTRVITLLIGWGFGNFMEGIAGFGTSVAIPAAVMAGCGVDPLRSVVACLIANSVSTAFGSVGVPAMALAKAADMSLLELSFDGFLEMSGGFIIAPFLVVAAVSGVRALKSVWWLCLAAGLSFVVPCLVVARFVGPELPDVVGAIASMFTIAVLGRRVRADARYALKGAEAVSGGYPAGVVLRAACPFLLVVLLLGGYALLPASVKDRLPAGVVVFIAAVLGGFVQRMSPRQQLEALKAAFFKNAKTYLTICLVLAMARVMDFSGAISVLAEALVAATGRAYVFFAPLVGALGGFITGSGTSSNVIFGALQAKAAAASALGVKPAVVVAANMFGGGIGKMLCPQSIAIGLAAVGLAGQEHVLLTKTIGWFFVILVLASVSCGLLALFL